MPEGASPMAGPARRAREAFAPGRRTNPFEGAFAPGGGKRFPEGPSAPDGKATSRERGLRRGPGPGIRNRRFDLKGKT